MSYQENQCPTCKAMIAACWECASEGMEVFVPYKEDERQNVVCEDHLAASIRYRLSVLVEEHEFAAALRLCMEYPNIGRQVLSEMENGVPS